MNAIEIHDLHKGFGRTNVIKGIDLCVQEGEFFGLIGKNGAGKTTLINVLTGAADKTSGQFQILNTIDTQLDDVKHFIGVMPDTSSLYDNMSGFEFLKYMATLKKIKLAKAQLKKLFDDVCLDAPAQRKIKDYSFGMKKKIAVAQALIGNPQLIFLDEPTAGVDPESILHLQKLFKVLNRSGTTVFLTSHNLNEIEKLCTHIAILNEGTFQVNGELKQIINNYTKNVRVVVDCDIPENFSFNEDFTSVHLLESENKQLVFEVDNQYAISETLSLLMAHGVKIYSVLPQKTTLEEIFTAKI